jgi:hypothetical protein
MLQNVVDNGRSTPGPDLKNDAEIVIVKPVPQPAKKRNAKKK